MSFYLTNAAVDDLIGIGAFTEERWGRDQRDRYLEQLDQAFHHIDQEPETGRSSEHIRTGYRQLRVGRHWVYFRHVGEQDVEIVRVLHDSMDPPRHFK